MKESEPLFKKLKTNDNTIIPMKRSSLDIMKLSPEPEQKSYPHMNTGIPPLLSDDSTTTSVSAPTVDG